MEDNIEKLYLTYKRFLLILIAILLFHFGFFCKANKVVISINKMKNLSLMKNKTETIRQINKNSEISQLNNTINENIINISSEKCYLSNEYSNIKIIHLIFTRFLIVFYKLNGFPNKMYDDGYILNGIRVMKKYLFPSLENQKCKNFTWILMLGNKANITYIESIINFNNSFDYKIIYQKDIKKYVREKARGFDILITTRIDYDDEIYFDAVNDVRKTIYMNKPILLHGYNRGLYFFEFNGKYYDYYHNYNNDGVMSIFFSLIINLTKVNDTYTILDLGDHRYIRKRLLEKYKLFGIKELDYEPTIFDEGRNKFIYVRQNYSGSFNQTGTISKNLKERKLNLSIFYGK